MKDALLPMDEDGKRVYLVANLPLRVKVALGIMIIAPRAAIAMRVLYLGSRWLLATTNYGELVLNAVALEFVLLIRNMMYNTVVSGRSKHDLDHTKIFRRTRQ